METTEAFVGLQSFDGESTFDPEAVTHRAPDSDSMLDPMYDYDRIDLTPEKLRGRPFESMWRYEELLPFPREVAVSLDEGATPLVDCPSLAETMGVAHSTFLEHLRKAEKKLLERALLSDPAESFGAVVS